MERGQHCHGMVSTPAAATRREAGALSPLTPSTTPSQTPYLWAQTRQRSRGGCSRVCHRAAGREKEHQPHHPSAPPLPVPALSCRGQGPPGQQTSPLHGLQTSGSCYTSHISSRAGASPSPEKSPSRLPGKRGGLVEPLNRHKLVLADWLPCHQP